MIRVMNFEIAGTTIGQEGDSFWFMTCQSCGRVHHSQNRKRKYCGDACKQRAYREKHNRQNLDVESFLSDLAHEWLTLFDVADIIKCKNTHPEVILTLYNLRLIRPMYDGDEIKGIRSAEFDESQYSDFYEYCNKLAVYQPSGWFFPQSVSEFCHEMMKGKYNAVNS